MFYSEVFVLINYHESECCMEDFVCLGIELFSSSFLTKNYTFFYAEGFPLISSI